MSRDKVFCTALVGHRDGTPLHCDESRPVNLQSFELPDGWAFGVDNEDAHNVVCGHHAKKGTRLVTGGSIKYIKTPGRSGTSNKGSASRQEKP